MADTPLILVIEDDEPTREAVLLKFDGAGLASEYATNGAEGLEKLRSGTAFDGILLDLRMPNVDGFAFLEQKNKDPHIRDIPVVIFSNFSQPEFISRAVALGAKGYLVKAQHSIEDILAEVRSCVTGGICTIDS